MLGVIYKRAHMTARYHITGVCLRRCDGGNLYERARSGTVPEEEAQFFFKQICAGVEYCHGQGEPLCLAAAASRTACQPDVDRTGMR
jgi:hypothetical protein